MCKHDRHEITNEVCFTGPIAGADENRAAHGNVTWTHTCSDCGAERDQNVNQWHVETGPWGVSRAERDRAEAAQKRAARQAAERVLAETPIAPRITCGDKFAAQDPDGFLSWGSTAEGLPAWWLERAKAYRSAWRACHEA